LQKSSVLCPLLFWAKWAFGHKSGFIEKLPTVKVWVKPKKSGLLPTFKNKSGLGKTQYSCGFAGFLPTFPLFFII
jgi:hypothetical protein